MERTGSQIMYEMNCLKKRLQELDIEFMEARKEEARQLREKQEDSEYLHRLMNGSKKIRKGK